MADNNSNSASPEIAFQQTVDDIKSGSSATFKYEGAVFHTTDNGVTFYSEYENGSYFTISKEDALYQDINGVINEFSIKEYPHDEIFLFWKNLEKNDCNLSESRWLKIAGII